MTSIGQLTGHTCIALWRRRFTVLAIMFAWLALDGLLLGYLNAFHPAFGLTLPRAALRAIDPAWLMSDWIHALLLLPQHYARDVVRAVFVILLLRALLAPIPRDGAGRNPGLAIPVLLILVFEIAWTTLLQPIDHVFTLTIARAASGDTADAVAVGYTSALVKGAIFACYALAMSKLCFVYPNATVHHALRPGRSCRDTSGLAVKLFLLFVAIPIPFVVIRTLLTSLVLGFGTIPETPQEISLFFLALNSVQEVPSAVVTLAVVAVAYVAATGHAAAAVPRTGRSPGELAEAFE